jgi:iron complex outermembrane receptor protein
MRTFKKIIFISGVLLFNIDFSYAQDAEDKLNLAFNPQVFSISKKKESSFDSASAIYVLPSEDIRRSGATSIPEALRLVPGVQVARLNNNSYAITIRGFERQFSNKLLVMIDGRTIYNTIFSGVFWDEQDYVLEDIDRIEVVRGPGGTIWGANAVNGVINIITKNSAQTKGFYASQIVGNKDRSITELRYGAENKSKDNYRLYAKTSYRKGLNQYGSNADNNDVNFNHRTGFRYDVTSIKNQTISLKGDIYKSLAKNYFINLNNSNENNKSSDGANLLFGWDSKISKKSKTTLNSYIDYHLINTSSIKRIAKTFDIDFQHFYSLSSKNQITWGLGYRQMQDNIQLDPHSTAHLISYSSQWRNDELFTGFLQEKLTVNDFIFIIGSKFEKNDFTGFEFQPNAKLIYYPSRNQTLWTSVSRAIRTPNRGDDDVKINTSNGQTTIYTGSDTFQAENMIAYETGYRIKPTYKSMIDVSTFYNQYTRLRTWEGPSNSSAIAANMGKGNSHGFEVSGKWQATDKLLLEISYDYLKLKTSLRHSSTDSTSITSSFDSLKISEGQSPRNQLRLRSFFNITSNLEFDNIFYFVDSLPTGAGNMANQKGLPSYLRFDTRIGYQPNKAWDLSFGIQNLLNQRHREFKPSMYNRQIEVGRMFYAKIVWQY